MPMAELDEQLLIVAWTILQAMDIPPSLILHMYTHTDIYIYTINENNPRGTLQ